jgi:CspA family cold shock protein
VTNGPERKTQGSVKWFSAHKHYGFIATDEGEEVFFHERQLLANNGNGPHKGQRAQFHIHYPIKGPEALNVELFED